MRTHIRRFKLSDTFIEQYRDREVPWGPLGYVTFKRTYARRLSEFDEEATGSEEWFQTCRRVIEGMFEMQKQHVYKLGLEWNDAKAQKTAKDAYDRLFNLKVDTTRSWSMDDGYRVCEQANCRRSIQLCFPLHQRAKHQGWLPFRLDDGCSYARHWCWF